ncbi:MULTISPECIES: ATP-binding cassette domain-containing protein [unclassified Moorena]|uniref:ABC transporter ATP-binding protein n=1 Tax=unclassified Moorena TaxID=2683338 RepID=UPI0013C83B9E|nr:MULTISPECIES: ATP-binding cassette domain-containing protein [unclassified Moorena]NEO18861.1 ATP-binding cassette domain-containing protein [Moorena sp. SIO4A5]NEQ56845.1 ATP-binding cassette domain-containing protein [Moorena sp. SIO4A1]
MTNPLLQLKQVSLTLSTRSKAAGIPILTDISFEVSPCDRISVIGPSGAGKTSLLRLLNRLSESTQGNIYLDNQNIRNIPVLELRRQVMLVPQEPKLLGMTVQEALAYPLVLQQLPKKAIGRRPRYANAQRTQEIRERLRIPAEWLERTELQLSLGQRQLVAIARALVVKPRIVLLDEPTSALDAGIASQVIRVFTDLAQKEQITILMVNHQLDMAELFCNRVLYLQDTQLLQDSPAEQINWQQLRERLVQAEAKASQEWA